MRIIFLLASQTGTGVNTIAVNLASGLARSSYRVLLSGACVDPGLIAWLEGPGNDQAELLKKFSGLEWRRKFELADLETTFDHLYDYLIYIPGKDKEHLGSMIKHQALTICVIDAGKDDADSIISMDEKFRRLCGGTKGFDLLVSNKVRPGEWDKSSTLIFDLAGQLGWDKLADPIPYCEAIHDLAMENKSVWDLPSQYSNRQEAFQRLVQRVVELS
ncbi:MAG TPA: hypothetical protein VN426_02490 [Syntrophomonadaceae bacterium]|nr:hypothetical protein [Syntrophomonadaceae bacterium]